MVLLGATEVDLGFNVNVHTDSSGSIMGGSGGHSDTAAGAKLAMIIAPLSRARLPIVRDRVQCISTPGSTIDVLVTQRGVAVNPARPELKKALEDARLPVCSIEELKARAEAICGTPRAVRHGKKVVADVIYRDGTVIDQLYNVE